MTIDHSLPDLLAAPSTIDLDEVARELDDTAPADDNQTGGDAL